MRIIGVLLCLSCMLPFRSQAWHIIGGEFYYTCQGGNNYELTLKIYRDCNSSTPFDSIAFIGVYDAANHFVQMVQIPFPGSVVIDPDLSDPCLQLPPGICVEQSIYKTTVNLPPISGGYNISYQRCCRNNTIVNVYDPQNTGATFTTHIPDNSLAACNSSPHFKNYPPVVICVDKPLIFDHSATDPDGDLLVYSLCTPYQGATAGNPQPIPADPPPYDPIIWQPPYNVNNQIGGSPLMTIDPNSGLLTAYPTALGQFVVGVCVKEYRNGNLLSQDIRDFQFNITTCNPLILANFTAATATPINDTLLICGTNTVEFSNQSFGTNDFHWDFGVAGITTDVSTNQNPVYTYPDTGVYEVTLLAAPGLYCGDTIYKYIEIRKGVQADFTFQNECAKTPLQFTDQSVPLDGTLTTWQWDFGDGNVSGLADPAHAYASGGTYNATLNVYNNYGCTASIIKSVTVYALPVINAGPDTFICDIDSVTLHAEDGVSYQWLPNYNINDPSSAHPLVKPKVTTVYTVTVINSNGCSETDAVTVQVTDTVLADVSSDAAFCENDSIQLAATNAVYYSWSPFAGLSNPFISDPMASPSTSTTYYVTSYIGSCFDVDTINITVFPLPIADAGDDVTINQGESIQLNATGSGTFQWFPPDNLNDPLVSNPVANPLNTTVYAVVVTNNNGCFAEDSVTVTVTHLHLIIAPNAFTPNGDGLNDNFIFFTKGIQKITSVKIFNRWGQEVYYSNGNDEGWNGYFKGEPSELGVYIFVISGITYDGDEILQRGNLTLLR